MLVLYPRRDSADSWTLTMEEEAMTEKPKVDVAKLAAAVKAAIDIFEGAALQVDREHPPEENDAPRLCLVLDEHLTRLTPAFKAPDVLTVDLTCAQIKGLTSGDDDIVAEVTGHYWDAVDAHLAGQVVLSVDEGDQMLEDALAGVATFAEFEASEVLLGVAFGDYIATTDGLVGLSVLLDEEELGAMWEDATRGDETPDAPSASTTTVERADTVSD
jgi:hypothetical protein